MKSRASSLIAVAIFFYTGMTYAEEPAPAPGSASVAEMMQTRLQNQLREQLVNAGRVDEVRKLDEENVKRRHEKQQKVIAQMNDELARAGRFESAPGGMTYDCDLGAR